MCPPTPELLAAYRATRFRVIAPEGEFVLRVDQPSEPLKQCHARHGVSSSLYITAWNPASRALAREENEARQRRLVAVVESRELAWLEGFGEDPEGKWEGEPSLLVLGADMNLATELGREFGQCAVVYSDHDAVPRLVVLDYPP